MQNSIVIATLPSTSLDYFTPLKSCTLASSKQTMADIKEGDRRSRNLTTEVIAGDNIRRTPYKKNLANAQWHEISKVTEDLKASLPVLRPFEVRRYNKPYHEAILCELEEDGYQEAADYIKGLFKLDDDIKQRSGPGTLIWRRPFLKDNKEFVDCLRDGLLTCEEAAEKWDHNTEASALLDIAIFFQSKTWEWWWVAEQVYLRAVTTAKLIENDLGYMITLARYLYGRFLFEQLGRAEEAISYLNQARDISEMKVWNASRKLHRKEESIFRECNIILFKALLNLARKIGLRDPRAALRACETAVERAKDTTQDIHIVEALHDVGKCYVRTGAIEKALKSFSKLLAIAKRIPDHQGVCNAHKELAFAYKELSDKAYTEKHLSLYRESAMHFHLTDQLADAHYYTGEHYLSEGQPDIATKHLEIALDLYNTLNMKEDADRTRSIAGISRAQERIAEYLNLILRCGEHDPEATLKICHWKSQRIDFTKDVDHGSTCGSGYFENLEAGAFSPVTPNSASPSASQL